eukprot:g41919.t1
MSQIDWRGQLEELLQWRPSPAVHAALHHGARYVLAFLLFWLAIGFVWFIAWKLVLSKIPLLRELAGLETKSQKQKPRRKGSTGILPHASQEQSGGRRSSGGGPELEAPRRPGQQSQQQHSSHHSSQHSSQHSSLQRPAGPAAAARADTTTMRARSKAA